MPLSSRTVLILGLLTGFVSGMLAAWFIREPAPGPDAPLFFVVPNGQEGDRLLSCLRGTGRKGAYLDPSGETLYVYGPHTVVPLPDAEEQCGRLGRMPVAP